MTHQRWSSPVITLLAAGTLLLGGALTCPAQQSPTPKASSKAPNPAAPKTNRRPFAECLPSGITLDKVVEAKRVLVDHKNTIVKFTVNQKLKELKAYCNASQELVDGKGKPIYFYQETGCRGASPNRFEVEQMREKAKELDALKQRYDVIEMTCNPSGIPIP